MQRNTVQTPSCQLLSWFFCITTTLWYGWVEEEWQAESHSIGSHDRRWTYSEFLNPILTTTYNILTTTPYWLSIHLSHLWDILVRSLIIMFILLWQKLSIYYLLNVYIFHIIIYSTLTIFQYFLVIFKCPRWSSIIKYCCYCNTFYGFQSPRYWNKQ